MRELKSISFKNQLNWRRNKNNTDIFKVGEGSRKRQIIW